MFASDRERRLWAWTLAVVVGIFSTLGVARALTEMLADAGLTDLVIEDVDDVYRLVTARRGMAAGDHGP
ncbi:MAG: hypothetical protein GY913_20800 [Proteobacteria bacterium]|nr:hypothetical protein [Pseudomonadota bacterium]MCP4919347.1 hypothetical protein [Pseudomonadota bacterium]